MAFSIMEKIIDKEDVHDPSQVSAKLRGETMAFAAQSAVYNLGANFFEPYINYRVQKYYSQTTSKIGGNYTQNLAGEFAGDVIGASTLMMAEAVCPKQLHATSRKIRSWIDPLYASIAQRVLSDEKDLPDYEQRIEHWKTFQERNLVRSAIIATSGLVGNIATQKWLIGNPSPTQVILAGKLMSTTLTTMISLSVRFAFPIQTKNMDTWVGEKLFKPWLDNKVLETTQEKISHVTRLNQVNNSSWNKGR
jgi:hypothetical protein